MTVQFSRRAAQQIEEIYTYYFLNETPERADKVLQSFYVAFDSCSQNPYLFPKAKSKSGSKHIRKGIIHRTYVSLPCFQKSYSYRFYSSWQKISLKFICCILKTLSKSPAVISFPKVLELSGSFLGLGNFVLLGFLHKPYFSLSFNCYFW
jgi:plasmid stabilization system protein ParE